LTGVRRELMKLKHLKLSVGGFTLIFGMADERDCFIHLDLNNEYFERDLNNRVRFTSNVSARD